MIRWIAILMTLLLAGCVTTREVVYRDGTYRDGYAYTDDRYYDDGYRERRYADGNYYTPSYAGRGDYYSSPGFRDYPSWYWDYPAFYSVFWPLYRSWHDPFWPGYYYGVTYFPRSYFSIGFHSGWGWPSHSYLYYSPYRYSWVDNYYDWTPWHRYRSHRHSPQPRFGSARNEAERLSLRSDWRGGRGARAGVGGYDGARNTAYGRYGTTRSGARDADYSGQPAPRQDPGVRGFGLQREGAPGEVRRNAAGATRGAAGGEGYALPSGRGFGRDADYGDARDESRRGPRYGTRSDTGGSDAMPQAREEIGRYVGPRDAAPRYRSEGGARGYDAGVALPRSAGREYDGARGAPVVREFARPAPTESGYPAPTRHERVWREPARESFGASSPAPREAGGFSAPAPRYSAPEPRYSAPEPRYAAPEPAPRQESPRFEESRSERAESRHDSGSRGGVRRVGSNRDD